MWKMWCQIQVQICFGIPSQSVSWSYYWRGYRRSSAVLQVNLCQKLFFLQKMGRTCCVQKLLWMSETIFVRNMFSPRLSFWQRFTCTGLRVYKHTIFTFVYQLSINSDQHFPIILLKKPVQYYFKGLSKQGLMKTFTICSATFEYITRGKMGLLLND